MAVRGTISVMVSVTVCVEIPRRVPAAAAGGRSVPRLRGRQRARHHRAASESPAEMAGSLSLMRHPLQRATEAEDHAGGRH